MTLVHQRLASLISGVSKKAPLTRSPAQAEAQINVFSTVERGMMRRPPLKHVAKLASTGVLRLFHPVDRDINERYYVLLVDNTFRAFEATTGSELTIVDRRTGGSSYVSPSGAFKALTVGDTTILVNTGVVPKMSNTKSTAVTKRWAMIVIRQGDYSTRYEFTVDGHLTSYTTPSGNDPSARQYIDTAEIADQLLINVDPYVLTNFFTYNLGSVILLEHRLDNTDFTITVTDGLAGQGIRLIKEKVESFADLPRKALDGLVVEITGDDQNQFDNFWVKYQSSTNTWVETLAPSLKIGASNTTLPLRLIRGGNLLASSAHQTFTPPVTVTDPVGSYTNFNWATYEPGGIDPGGSGFPLTQHVTWAEGVAGGDGNTHTWRIYYSVSTVGMTVGATVSLKVGKNTSGGSTSFTNIQGAGKTYAPGGTWLNEYIEFTTSLNTGAEFRLLLAYLGTEGQTPATPATISMHATTENPGFEPIKKASADLQKKECRMIATTFIPKHSTLTITLDGNAFTETTSSGDSTWATVAAAIATTINNHANYNATYTTDGSFGVVTVQKDPLDTQPATTAVITFATTLFYNPDLTLTANEFSGKTLKNLTDGSTGTVSENGTKWVKVGSLSGGLANVFSKNDLVSVTEAGTYFTLEECPWDDRLVGDDTTNPIPDFFEGERAGVPFKSVFFVQNRLGFTAGEHIWLSESGNLFNFWRTTVTQLVDSDPISVKSAHPQVSVFYAAPQWRGYQMLLAETGQFVLSGEPVLTPRTVRIDRLSSFRASPEVEPQVLGNSIFWPYTQADNAAVFQYWVPGDADYDPRADSITGDVPNFLVGDPVAFAGEGSLGALAISMNQDKRRIYFHTYASRGGQKIQESWNYFEMPLLSEVHGLGFTGGGASKAQLGVVTKHADGFYLGFLDFDVGEDATDEKYKYVDRWQDGLTGVFDSMNNWTTWTFTPVIATNGTEGVVMVVDKADGTVLSTTRPTSTSVRATGDHSSKNVRVGVQYTFLHQFSPVYLRLGDYSQPETQGRYQLRYLDLDYRKSTDFTVLVTPVGRSAYSKTFTSATPATGTLRVPIQSRGEDTVIAIQNSTPGGCRFVSADFEGFIHTRGRRL